MSSNDEEEVRKAAIALTSTAIRLNALREDLERVLDIIGILDDKSRR